jgi:glutathione peroxidase
MQPLASLRFAPALALLAVACSSPPASPAPAAAGPAVPDTPEPATKGSTVYDIPLRTLDGADTTLSAFQGDALLIVNVASECGLTPQYAGLQKLHETYGERGLVVVGLPCNQFGGQEPGSPDQIRAFCDARFGVTFPLMEKVEVNGDGRHPLYRELVAEADASGAAGDVQWNFEKFLVAPDGSIQRFRPRTTPDDPTLVGAIEAALPR